MAVEFAVFREGAAVVRRVPAARSALPSACIVIMQFDPRNGRMVLFGDTYADSDYNRAEAERHAQEYARQAAENGMPFQYLVVRTQTLAAFTAQDQ